MSRGRKLLIVSIVLLVGCVMAWPFRKTGNENRLESNTVAQVQRIDGQDAAQRVARPPATETHAVARIETLPTTAKTLDGQPRLGRIASPVVGRLTPHVVAKQASLNDNGSHSPRPVPNASFDMVNHPAFKSLGESPITPTATRAVPPNRPQPLAGQRHAPKSKLRDGPRPTYATIEREGDYDFGEIRREDIRHVVQNSDTLERIAKRYLGDESRALEIFDLNRDVLENPHLLPIEAELRLPVDAKVTLDWLRQQANIAKLARLLALEEKVNHQAR